MPNLQQPLDDETYAAINWVALAGTPEDRHFQWALASRFWERARELSEAGELAQSQALQVLGGAISMHMRHASHASFGPAMQMEGRRSMSMEDLGEHDIALLARAAADAPHPWLRARFADLAVSAEGSIPPDWRLGRLAANAYLDYAIAVFGSDWAIDGLDEIRRGLVLARVYAKRDETLWGRYWSAILKEVPHAIEQNWPGLVFRLCDEALDRSREACEVIVPQIEAKAAELDVGSPQQAADWHKLAHRLRWRLGQRSESNAALMAQGEAMTRAAAWSAKHQPILAPMQLTEAISILRRAKAEPTRIQALRDQLTHYERASLDHYGHHSHEFDATDWIKWIDQQLEAPSFFASLLRMAYQAGKVVRMDELEERVRKNAQDHPLSHLFASTHANAEGAIVSRSAPFNADDPASVREHMIRDAAQFDLSLRARIMVSRSVNTLYSSYQPSFQGIKEIVEASIVAPDAQSETLARGLFAGFTADWLGTSVYLIPAMEPFVRHQLKRLGAHTMALDENGVQQEKTLGELLSMPEAEAFFGKDLVFELQVHLVEQAGFNLRNEYCHGLMLDDALENAGIMSLWWLLWRMILFPWHGHPAVLAPMPTSEDDASSEPDTTNSLDQGNV